MLITKTCTTQQRRTGHITERNNAPLAILGVLAFQSKMTSGKIYSIPR